MTPVEAHAARLLAERKKIDAAYALAAAVEVAIENAEPVMKDAPAPLRESVMAVSLDNVRARLAAFKEADEVYVASIYAELAAIDGESAARLA